MQYQEGTNDENTRLTGASPKERGGMPEGEHWFHTDEQMRFRDAWIRGSAK